MSVHAPSTHSVGTPSRTTGPDLETVAGGTILASVAAAERLRRSAGDLPTTAALLELLDDGDLLGRMLGLRALSAVPSRAVDIALVAALDDDELAEHASWALVERPPVMSAVPSLVRLVAKGGFAAMPAQLALEQWGAHAGHRIGIELNRALARCSTAGEWSRLGETLTLVRHPHRVAALRNAVRERAHHRSGTGLRVAQILLRGHVDAELEAAGSAEGGGVVTLLVQLARALGRVDGVESSTIIARRRETPAVTEEHLGPGASIVRLPFGPSECVPVSAMWEHRARVEHALLSALSTTAPIDVAHLRYADAGTFAAARALRRSGVRVVFTLAPDPHGLIDAGERTRTVSRESFAAADSIEHNLFRLRLADELTALSDHIVTLPRAGGRSALERLVGRSLRPERTTSVPEGIAVEPVARALERAVRPGAPDPAVVAELRSAIAGLDERRLGLPVIFSAGRFHPVKGFTRLVEAWAGDPALRDRFNLVLAGGDLTSPSPVEQEVSDEIEAALARHPHAHPGLVLLGARSHDEVTDLLALVRHGRPGIAAPGGLYACSSSKEEFGVAILEAMATGLAVVAPSGGGPDTYVEDGVTGVLVRPGCVIALRDGLHQAAELARSEARARGAMRLVRERFAIGPVASALADTYRRTTAAG